MIRTARILLPLLLLFTSCVEKQPAPAMASQEAAFTPPDQPLFDTIRAQDSLLFTAFNKRDLPGMANYLDSTLELFHDNTGVRDL
jgi:hypothetical protein